MSYIQEFISESTKSYSRWIGTEMEDYHLLGPKKKGDLGELIVEKVMSEYGHIVKPPSCGYNGPYDRNIDDFDTEIKFSVSQDKDDELMINHVKSEIKWDRFIFYGWNLIKPHRFVWCTKEDMEKCREDTSLWGFQSGEEEFMCSSANVFKWINSPYTRDIETWNDEPKLYTGLEGFLCNGNICFT